MGLVLDSVSCLVCTSLPVSDFAIVLSSLLNDSLLSKEASTHRPHSSSCLGLPYRILHMNPKRELLWSPWVVVSLRQEPRAQDGDSSLGVHG